MRHPFVHEWFAATAKDGPDRVAINASNASVTYRELDLRSTAIANGLIACGAGREEVVGIYTDDRSATIVAMLGILKAGCAFAPLPPTLGRRSLAAMLQGCDPGWTLIAPEETGAFEAVSSEAGIRFDNISTGELILASSASRSRTLEPARIGCSMPDDLCYIFFTSGSSGRPKPIAGRLKAIDHFIRWEIDTFGLDEGVRVSQLFSLSFDACLRDIFVPLCAGGTICLPHDRDLLLDPERLIEWLEERDINLIHSVPSLFRTVLSHLSDGMLRIPALRYVFLSGEPLLPADVQQFYTRFADRGSLVNLYGPSETTMTKLFHRVTRSDQDASRIPIGQPMRGAAALLIDDYGEPCPPGAVGELFLRTPYRSLGYYRDPELTNAVFVRNPFNPDPADIIYKTGDLARMRADGSLEYLGRRDRQVKIRGIRVELDDIENRCRQCPDVANAALVWRGDEASGGALCAYLVLRPGALIDAVKRDISTRLPAHMLPRDFVVLERLPLLPNGKLDVSSLPRPEDSPPSNSAPGSPWTPVEEIVAGIWSRVLDRQWIGREANFFAIGGHSLIAMQVIARLRAALGVELPVRALFEEPTIKGFAATVERFMTGNESAALPPLRRVARDRKAPLSFAQQRLWLVEQLAPGQSAYNSAKAVRLRGALKVGALRSALYQIVRRHEVLRTSFVTEGGAAAQVIEPASPPVLPVIDLRSYQAGHRRRIARKIIRLEAQLPFDLGRGPLIRAHLLNLDEDDHILLLTTHHAVSDGWSVGILVDELSALYGAACSNQPSPLRDLPVQYADYAIWQRAWLCGDGLERQLNYWRGELAGMPSLELAADHRRPAIQDTRGARFEWRIRQTVAADLRRLAQQHGVTMFMVLLGAFDVLLARYSGQSDIAVGTDVANRRSVELEGLVGCFVNQLVLRTDLEGDPSFAQLLARVREKTLAAYTHQDLPFEKLVEALAPDRDLSRTPLFQCKLLFQNVPPAVLKLPGLEVERFDGDAIPARFDLTLALSEEDDGLHGTLDYACSLYEQPTIARMSGHFERLLAEAASDAGRRISTFSMLSEEEYRELVFARNHTRQNSEHDRICVHHLIASHAMSSPDSIAVIDGDSHVSYEELNGRSNQVARYLQSLGAAPDVRVALFMSRSSGLVIALLATLKAGAAYVPIDVASPAARVIGVIDDAQAALIISDSSHAAMLPQSWAQVVMLDRESGAIAAFSREDPRTAISPQNLAYVIHTSGSTGRPKGVMITHGGLSNYVQWAAAAYRADEGSGSPVHSSVGFDLTVTSLLPLLAAGNRARMLPDSAAIEALGRDPEVFRDCTLVKLTPPHLRALADVVSPLEARSFTRLFVVGGEALSGDVLTFWRDRNPDVRVVNEYGPTETVVGCSVYEVPSGDVGGADVPVGRPIANTQVYVLDAGYDVMPAVVPGELFIGGAGVARGYQNQPALTAERFVPDPYGHLPGARLYRTGDRARWRFDGELEFLGRLDEQVKLRGYRIEPAEIESALTAHPHVSKAVVVLREDSPGDSHLVAYVVPASPLWSERELRQHLASLLPAYMIPDAYVALEVLPLTSNGKLHRDALPAPDRRSYSGQEALHAPTATEEIVAGIWCEVLRREQVGLRDDFFSLGGHSLLATQVIARVRAALGVELPLRVLFESPTVTEVAAAVDLSRAGSVARIELPVRPVPREQALPLSFAQHRLWFLAQLESASPAYHVPATLRLKGKLRIDVLRASLAVISQRHETLRTSFAVRNGLPVQAISAPSIPRLTLVTLSVCSIGEAERLTRAMIERENCQPFDLTQGPLWRAYVVRLGNDDHVLSLTFHHIVCDGWSMEILLRELSTIYNALSTGTRFELEPLPVQYADIAAAERALLEDESFAPPLQYWLGQLAGAPTLELPTDRPRPNVASGRGAILDFAIDSDLAGQVRRSSREAGVTTFMFLLTAFQIVLARYSGQNDVTVGTPVANRKRLESEGLIGLFVNTLVMRSRWNERVSIDALLAQVRDTVLDAYAHQDLPFEKLVEAIAPARDLSRAPLFQVMLSLEHGRRDAPPLSGLTAEPFSSDRAVAKFDVTLGVSEASDAAAWSARFEYATDLFDSPSIERLSEHLQVAVRWLTGNRLQTLDSLSLLSEAERSHLLLTVNATRHAVGDCVLSLVKKRARERPDAVAVDAGTSHLTYGELTRWASRLARHLLERGVRAEVPVGIAMGRGAALPIALLGVMESGAPYLPLDPSHPAERLAHTLSDAGVQVLLTDTHEGARMAAAARGVRDIIALDGDWNQVASAPNAAVPSSHSEQLAYIIYTSGSTGRPKGVGVTRGALANFVEAMQHGVSMSEADRLVAVTTLSFDIAQLEMLWPLTVGARLIIASRDTAQSGNALSELLERKASTVIQATPATWEMLRAAGWKGRTELTVLCGGEALRAQLAATMVAWGGPVWNLYGPTETTIWSMCARLDSASLIYGVPIGLPISNTRAYVVQSDASLSPTGIPGELWIGGAGIARGYVGQPGLTAECFVPDPFGAAGGRLYRTGDRVRWRTDGQLEFLGRIDHQVKLRGYRIELSEIEGALDAHPAVRQCAVAVRGDGVCAQLVGYIVPVDAPPRATDLDAHVRSKLPEYMAPNTFLFLKELPRTPNGKLDRRSLPNPSAAVVPDGSTDPLTPIEELIASIWAEVLGRPSVGRDANFFDLGGHSLLATQVIARLQNALRVAVPVRALFEAPTVAQLANRIAAGDRPWGTPLPPLEPVRRDAPLPLSFAQQRLWFLHQLDPSSTAYNIASAIRLRGTVRVDSLRASLEFVVARHEALRTAIVLHSGEPMQVVHAPCDVLLPVIDLSVHPSAVREEIARAVAVREARRPFDLARGPVLRAHLLRLEDDDHVLLLAVHHMACDGWSLEILRRELAVAYSAERTGIPSTLPGLPVQYADFAVWQRSWLMGTVLDHHLEHWRAELTGVPPLDLQLDAPRPPAPSGRGAESYLQIPAAVARRLRDICRQHDVTRFMLLATAFQVLLGRYSGQSDIAIGTPIANRTRLETEGLIGCFVNTLVLRTKWDGRIRFTALLERVRETVLNAYAHQDLPFEKLVEVLAPERDLSRAPLFQVMFAFQNAPQHDIPMASLQAEPFSVGAHSSAFDLTLFTWEHDEGLHARFEYAADLFEPATLQRLGQRFASLLSRIADCPSAYLDEFDLLTQSERDQVLTAMNATADRQHSDGVHRLVAAQAAATPDAIAVESEHRQVSYAELRRRVRHVAAHLRAIEVQPEEVIGVSVSRGPGLVVALLGVLEAGAAYLPLDAGYPTARLTYMLETAEVRILLTDAAENSRLSSEVTSACATIALDENSDVIGSTPWDDPCEVRADQLAYVIFTSGSTGRPKGVAVTHGGLTNFLTSIRTTVDLIDVDRLVAVTTISFDIAGLEIYTPLICGARLIFATREMVTSPADLSAFIRSREASILQATPVLWRELCATSPALPDTLKVLCGGEALWPELARTLLAGGGPVWNLYGPTETTVWSLAERLTGLRSYGVSIGRPLANTSIYIVDEFGHPTLPGVPGELAIGGAGLARGYLDEPALTAERFLPDPFGGIRGSRLYRTGDRVRWRSDGGLEFLGRFDHQVKLRGHRIELGEIETTLNSHPAVSKCVVSVRNVADAPRLVAYVIPNGGPPEWDTVQRDLRGRLPEYMIPAVFIAVNEFPVTPNGKIDRRALPAPDWRALADSRYVAPRTSAEEILVQIWSEVLGVERVGIQDNFFRLGGDSIQSVKIVSRANQFGFGLKPRHIFEYQTIQELALAVEPVDIDKAPAIPSETKHLIAAAAAAAGEDSAPRNP